ncbi:MAG: helix-turn-helix domain-containing protein [Gammaproteobacteria bacterium]
MQQQARTTNQIGSIIRRVRRSKGLTQSELGEKVGLRQATISRLEAGEPNTRIETLMDAMSALGLEFLMRQRTDGIADEPTSLEDWF